MVSANVLYFDNGRGLTRDANILITALERLNIRASLVPLKYGRESGGRHFWEPSLKVVESDISFTLESMLTTHPPSQMAVFIPNPEWTERADLDLIREHYQAVFVKTRQAEKILRSEHPSVQFMGFTSQKIGMGTQLQERSGCLHLAGDSPIKGTSLVLEAWARNKNWPHLTLVATSRIVPKDPLLPNVTLVRSLAGNELKFAVRKAEFHICLSQTEGWGHYIYEAMSSGGVVVVPDVPPLNELVDSNAVVGIPAALTHRSLGLAPLNVVAIDVFEETFSRALSQGRETNVAMGTKARESINGCLFVV